MVALKVLPADRVANAERRRRFIQEAQLASALQHPNIVTIFDIGSAEGGEYLAMELVRGRTLDTLIPQPGLPLHDGAPLREPDRGRARGGACRRHRPPRSQAGQHHGDRPGPDQDPRLRPRHAVRDESRARRRRDAAARGAGRDQCRDDPRHGRLHVARSRPRAARWMRAPTSSRSARFSTRCCPACARSTRRSRPTPSPP